MKRTLPRFIHQALPAVLTLALVSLAGPARADIILSIESVTGAPGSSGTFDVLLTNTGPASQNIDAFFLELSTSDTNITFTGVTTSTTTQPYIFAGDSLFGPIIATSGPGQVVDASDVSASSGNDVGLGQEFGIGSVAYSIDPGATNGEIATINFDAFPLTSLSDSLGNNVDFTAQSGTITVQSTSTVPEPSTALPLVSALLFGAFLIRRRRAA